MPFCVQASSISTMSGQFQDMRAQLESDEQLKILMAGLRGSNLNDSDYAEEGVNMVMVEVGVALTPCALHSGAPLCCSGLGALSTG